MCDNEAVMDMLRQAFRLGMAAGRAQLSVHDDRQFVLPANVVMLRERRGAGRKKPNTARLDA